MAVFHDEVEEAAHKGNDQGNSDQTGKNNNVEIHGKTPLDWKMTPV
jgi:hypothetical protein